MDKAGVGPGRRGLGVGGFVKEMPSLDLTRRSSQRNCQRRRTELGLD